MDENKTVLTYIDSVSTLEELKKKVLSDLEADLSSEDINKIKNKYTSRKGLISGLFSNLSILAENFQVDKKQVGETLNYIKSTAETKVGTLTVSTKKPENKISFDPTYTKIESNVGILHPITREKILTEEMFMRMGFDIIQDPIVDSDFHVFESLNIPSNHPARDNWDTFWTENDEVIRTQTTAFQNELLKKAKETNSFPIRAIQPGICTRNEATDARHEHTFYQVDGFYVSKNSEKRVTIVDLISTLRTFFSQYFGKEMNIRIQPAYFPFVEPGFEFAISCIFCDGKGCSVCSQSGWVEIGGTGMVHPNIYKFAGLNPEEYSGFAFGYGLDRMAQLKLDINDVRLFRSNDIRFIKNS